MDRLAVHQNLAAAHRHGAEYRLQQLTGAAAGQTGQRHDLAPAHRQVDILEPIAAQAVQGQQRPPSSRGS